MKVDVTIVKRPGVKVDVTLARGKPHAGRVRIPVRIAAHSTPEEHRMPDVGDLLPEETDFVPTEAEEFDADDVCDGEVSGSDDVSEADATDCGDEYEPEEYNEAEEYEETEEPEGYDEYPYSYDIDEFAEEDAPDEDDLLEMIAEEEAEMAAAGYGSAPQSSPSSSFEQISDGQFMRYFDLDENGDKHQSSDTQAVGQEIICMDSESGRLSRICGIIRHNQPQTDAFSDRSDESELPVFGQPQDNE